MNHDALSQKLLRAARQTPADERVPYTFEQRVMAGLVRQRDEWPEITRALWWAAAACSAIAIAMSIWTFSPDSAVATASADSSFAEDLELTILASVDPGAAGDPALDPELDLLW